MEINEHTDIDAQIRANIDADDEHWENLELEGAARYHVVICGLGRDAETREEVDALLAADTGWQEEGEYATILDRETGQEFTV